MVPENTLGAISADHKVRGLTLTADSSDRVLTKNWREKRAARVAEPSKFVTLKKKKKRQLYF